MRGKYAPPPAKNTTVKPASTNGYTKQPRKSVPGGWQ